MAQKHADSDPDPQHWNAVFRSQCLESGPGFTEIDFFKLILFSLIPNFPKIFRTFFHIINLKLIFSFLKNTLNKNFRIEREEILRQSLFKNLH